MPTVESRSPAQVAREVGRVLRGRLKRFDIERKDDGLILSGQAPTFYVKQLAQHAVRRLSRVPIASNDIEVAP
jgi:hypothetical protein